MPERKGVICMWLFMRIDAIFLPHICHSEISCKWPLNKLRSLVVAWIKCPILGCSPAPRVIAMHSNLPIYRTQRFANSFSLEVRKLASQKRPEAFASSRNTVVDLDRRFHAPIWRLVAYGWLHKLLAGHSLAGTIGTDSSVSVSWRWSPPHSFDIHQMNPFLSCSWLSCLNFIQEQSWIANLWERGTRVECYVEFYLCTPESSSCFILLQIWVIWAWAGVRCRKSQHCKI